MTGMTDRLSSVADKLTGTRPLCYRHRDAAGRRPLTPRGRPSRQPRSRRGDTGPMPDRNVLGGPLEPCGTDPLTGFYRDGCCSTGPGPRPAPVCAVVTGEFLEHQRSIGNDLSTPVPEYRFPGLVPGDRWCVTAVNWLRAHREGCAAPVVLASTRRAHPRRGATEGASGARRGRAQRPGRPVKEDGAIKCPTWCPAKSDSLPQYCVGSADAIPQSIRRNSRRFRARGRPDHDHQRTAPARPGVAVARLGSASDEVS